MLKQRESALKTRRIESLLIGTTPSESLIATQSQSNI